MDIISIVPSWILCSIVIFTALYLYFTRNHNYWQSRGVPVLKPYPLIGTIGGLFSKLPLHIQDIGNLKKLGKVYGAYFGNTPVLSIADPELLRSILVKDFHIFINKKIFQTGDPIGDFMVSNTNGEQWKRIRNILTPGFTSGKLKRMCSVINECTKVLVDNFAKAAMNGSPIECTQYFKWYGMDVIASSAFGTSIDSCSDPKNPFVYHSGQFVPDALPWRVIMGVFFPSILKVFGITLFPPESEKFFIDTIHQIIAERKQSGQSRNDLLQLLMDADKETVTDEEDPVNAEYMDDDAKKFFKSASKKSLTHDEMVAQSIVFFIAGFATSSNALSLVAYNLAVHPESQEVLLKEINDVIKSDDDIDYDTVHRLKYLDQVVCETLRMYPFLLRYDRIAVEDYELGDTGITIPKGMAVTIPVYAVHHDPDSYPDPEKYDPERFTPENKATRSPYSYLPFSAGPRNCIGMRFALMVIKLCIVRALRSIKFQACPQTQIPLKFPRGSMLLQPKEIILEVKTRSNKSAVSK